MVSIEFHLRVSKKGPDHPGSMYARVIARRRTASVTLSYRLYSHEWDSEKKQVVVSCANRQREKLLREISLEMECDRQMLLEIAAEKMAGDVTADLAAQVVATFKWARSGWGLKEIAGMLAGELQQSGKPRTARAYLSTFSALSAFCGREDISVEEINSRLIKDFQQWFLQRGRALNTVSFYMRNLRAICNKAAFQGWAKPLAEDLFKAVFTGVAASKKRALAIPELGALNNFLARPGALKEVQLDALHLFLFSMHGCGISFVDLAHLKKADIEDGVLYYKRRKTGTPLAIPVCPEMKTILRYFKDKTKDSPYLFPLIPADSESPYTAYTVALRRQNMLLQQIGRKAGLKSTLTTHVARHTWATMAKRLHVGIEVISECLGHGSVKTTSIYLDSFDHTVIASTVRKVSAGLKKKVG